MIFLNGFISGSFAMSDAHKIMVSGWHDKRKHWMPDQQIPDHTTTLF